MFYRIFHNNFNENIKNIEFFKITLNKDLFLHIRVYLWQLHSFNRILLNKNDQEHQFLTIEWQGKMNN